MVGELFGSESLSQVYAQLHTFMFQNEGSLKSIGEFVYMQLFLIGVNLRLYKPLALIITLYIVLSIQFNN